VTASTEFDAAQAWEDITARTVAIGQLVRVVRASKGLSIEESARRAGLGHMTLRRIESGESVRASSYSGLDRSHGLPAGTFLWAAKLDGGLAKLAAALGVRLPGLGTAPATTVVAEPPPPAPPVPTPTFDVFDLNTLRRVAALINTEITRIEADS
jgi:transcriptional regulator with XRE-family HTH domain